MLLGDLGRGVDPDDTVNRLDAVETDPSEPSVDGIHDLDQRHELGVRGERLQELGIKAVRQVEDGRGAAVLEVEPWTLAAYRTAWQRGISSRTSTGAVAEVSPEKAAGMARLRGRASSSTAFARTP